MPIADRPDVQTMIRDAVDEAHQCRQISVRFSLAF
jgi:hypothetical protein